MSESHVQRLSTILLDAITDKDPLVQEQVCGALCALGESRPEEVLLACAEHLRQHEKERKQRSSPGVFIRGRNAEAAQSG